MTEQQLVMPSPELVEQLRSEAPHGIRDMGATRERYLIHAAYRAGADQGLEVCCEWLDKGPYGFSIVASAPELTRSLRAALRSKPPSLADQGLIELSNLVNDLRLHGLGYSSGTIRAALERLKELEEKANG